MLTTHPEYDPSGTSQNALLLYPWQQDSAFTPNQCMLLHLYSQHTDNNAQRHTHITQIRTEKKRSWSWSHTHMHMDTHAHRDTEGSNDPSHSVPHKYRWPILHMELPVPATSSNAVMSINKLPAKTIWNSWSTKYNACFKP